MKYSRPVIAGSVLLVVALALVPLLVNPSGPDLPEDGALPGTSAASSGTVAPSPPSDSKYSRTERSKEHGESPDAKALKLLWARGRGQELLVALDQLTERADADDWRQVADVLVEQAANDGRHEIANYLLATGHGAPRKVCLSIYAAALENPDEDIRGSAKLELLNLTGSEFGSRQEADAWINSNPDAVRDEKEPEE